MKSLSKILSVVLCLAVVMAMFVIGASAAGTTYTFADYTAGTQYAANEVHVLDDKVTVTTTACHFTTQLRIYSSSTHDGYAIISSTEVIKAIVLNAGYKVDTLNVYCSTDGAAYGDPIPVSITKTSYENYTVDDLPAGTKYIKLDVAGDQQVRIQNMTLAFEGDSLCEHTSTTFAKDNYSHWYNCNNSECGATELDKDYHDFVNGVCSLTGCNATLPGTAGSLANGKYIIAFGNKAMTAVAADKTYGDPAGTEVTISGSTVTGSAIENVFTITNVTGGVTIQDHLGRYLYMRMDKDYSNFNLKDEIPSDGGHIWEVRKDGDNYILVNAGKQKLLSWNDAETKLFFNAYYYTANSENYTLTIVAAPADVCEHENTTGTWDTNQHWNVCSDSDCGAVVGSKENHTLTWKNEGGKHWQECACGYKSDKVDHAPVTKFDKDNHWTECACGDKSEKEGHTLSDGKCACGYEKDVVQGYFKVTGTLTSGDYVMVIDGHALSTLRSESPNKDWVLSADATINGNQVMNPAEAIVVTLTVDGNKVKITDANGKEFFTSGNKLVEKAGATWNWKYADGKYTFDDGAEGDDLRYLALNKTENGKSENGKSMFRAYKNSTLTGDYADQYAYSFTLYKYGSGSNSNTGDNSVVSVAVAAAVLSVLGSAVLISKRKEF